MIKILKNQEKKNQEQIVRIVALQAIYSFVSRACDLTGRAFLHHGINMAVTLIHLSTCYYYHHNPSTTLQYHYYCEFYSSMTITMAITRSIPSILLLIKSIVILLDHLITITRNVILLLLEYRSINQSYNITTSLLVLFLLFYQYEYQY